MGARVDLRIRNRRQLLWILMLLCLSAVVCSIDRDIPLREACSCVRLLLCDARARALGHLTAELSRRCVLVAYIRNDSITQHWHVLTYPVYGFTTCTKIMYGTAERSI